MKIFLYTILGASLFSLFVPWSEGKNAFEIIVPEDELYYNWTYSLTEPVNIFFLFPLLFIPPLLIFAVYYIDSNKNASIIGASVSILSFLYLSLTTYVSITLVGFSTQDFSISLIPVGTMYLLIMLMILFITFSYINLTGIQSSRSKPSTSNFKFLLHLFYLSMGGYILYLYFLRN